MRHEYTYLNEQLLTDAAFLPKKYTVRLEHGRFDDPSWTYLVACKKWRPSIFGRPYKYALHLGFDKAPFPPLEEWNEIGRQISENLYFSESKDFAMRKVPSDPWLVVVFQRLTKSVKNIGRGVASPP